MDGERQPIKRHEAIAPLSRHHHHALALVLKIRKAETAATKEQAEALRREVQRFWQNGGQQHFREEEEILLPAYARYASLERKEIIGMLLDHVKIRAMVDSIQDETDDVLPLIRKFGDMLEEHVRKEERVIFPMIEAALPEDVLRKLSPYFHEA